MTRTPFDRFSKDMLEELLHPFGEISIQEEVPGETQYVDVLFHPQAESLVNAQHLGVLRQICAKPCLIEPYRNPVTPEDIRGCLLKLLSLQAEILRRHRRDEPLRGTQPKLPELWILTPTCSQAVVAGFGAVPALEQMSGIYSLPASLLTHIVVIHQLPSVPETLWLRLLGRGRVQKQAIAEVLAISDTDPIRTQILRLLSSWKVSIELNQELEQEERELEMALSQAFLELEQKIEQRGLEQGLEQGLEEGEKKAKLEAIPRLLQLGLSVEQIADALDLPLVEVQALA